MKMNIKLNEDEIRVVEAGALYGQSAAYRNRCRIILMWHYGLSLRTIAKNVRLASKKVERCIINFSERGLASLQSHKIGGKLLVTPDSTEEKPRVSDISEDDKLLKPSTLVRLLCDKINQWDENQEMIASMDKKDIFSFLKNDVMSIVFFAGATPIINETGFNIERHDPVGFKGFPYPGCDIEETIDPGVEFDGQVLIKAKVKLKS